MLRNLQLISGIYVSLMFNDCFKVCIYIIYTHMYLHTHVCIQQIYIYIYICIHHSDQCEKGAAADASCVLSMDTSALCVLSWQQSKDTHNRGHKLNADLP